MRWIRGVLDLESKSINNTDVKIDKSNLNIIDSNALKTDVYLGKYLSVSTVTTEKNTKSVFTKNQISICGDITIFNQEELYSLLNNHFDNSNTENLVYELYNKFGPKFAEYINGEFAIIIWDESLNKLFLIRDQIGIKTLFWCYKNNEIWFSSDIELLLPNFSMQLLNNDYFLEFYQSNGCVNSSITPYKEVNRLRSGTFVEISNHRVVEREYWSLSSLPENPFGIMKNKDYKDCFLELFESAVEKRTSKKEINGVLLSGGLDSTSIYAMAVNYLSKAGRVNEIKAVSAVFDEYKRSDEREYIRLLTEMYGGSTAFKVCDSEYFFKGFPNHCAWSFEPAVNSASFKFTDSLIKLSSELGVKNLLTGYAGDHVLSGSSFQFADSLKRGRLLKLVSDVYSYSKVCRLSFPQVLVRDAINPLFGLSSLHSKISALPTMTKDAINKNKTLSKKEFCYQLNGTVARIYTDRVIASRYGINCSHPFLDKKLIEFLYSVPPNWKWNSGVTKVILRKGMKNKLPQEILDRKNKTDHYPLIYSGLRNEWPKLFETIREARISEFGLVSKSEWKTALINWRNGVETREDIWPLINLEIWLHNLDNYKSSI
ncbi:asparagine synthase (glutamine-hydrolyzing) [Paenibacillus phyllosphaerae]|uniref:asparagine synthase (glutamine-hydrolyzing) n=1 Tax=Paenibacillus phyllosphaerae TaxID=274593 RepID=A0A7W5B154_9BACL|nr:asparagine synthase-related protein [Paenibacillus phyllosphaerae]MBB3111976.1 asparagine synthase (glutamine-hydrolyzing) [Paenibacillus phyllosphaerae]